MSTDTGFVHVNARGAWPGLTAHQLAVAADGTLSIAAGQTAGAFRVGPVKVRDDAMPWFRVRLLAEPLPAGCHLRAFACAKDGVTPPPFVPGSADPFPAPAWQPAPPDQTDFLILQPPALCLWLGAALTGNGTDSPAVGQARVDWGRDTYLKYLPAIFARDDGPRDLLERLLALLESVFGGLDDRITDLPRLLDAATAPDAEDASWLTWLGEWLAFERSPYWTAAEMRARLGEAFALHGRRGTALGLRQMLKWYAGVDALVEEPPLGTFWSVGSVSALDRTTRVAPAAPQGAVLDSTAVLDQAYLSPPDAFGAALFDEEAHRFTVSVYAADLRRPGQRADVAAVLDRERPAHTEACLRVLAPGLRVGVQARVGIDAIVAAGPPPARLDRPLDRDVLGAPAEPCAPPGGAPV